MYKPLRGIEPNRAVYIFRVCKASKMDDLRDFIESEVKVEIRNLELVCDPTTWNTQSIKLSLPANELDRALNADWPAGIRVRQWTNFPKRDSSDSNSVKVK